MSKKGRARRTPERRIEDRENRSSMVYLQKILEEANTPVSETPPTTKTQ